MASRRLQDRFGNPHSKLATHATQPLFDTRMDLIDPSSQIMNSASLATSWVARGPRRLLVQIPELRELSLTVQEWGLTNSVVSRNCWVQYDRATSKSNVHANIIRQGGVAGHTVITAGDPDAVEKYLQTRACTPGHGSTGTFHISGSCTEAEVARHIDLSSFGETSCFEHSSGSS
jgi:hypothetical protein